MTDYVAAFDDSGGIEPLVKWGGEFVPGDHPITVLAFALVRSDLLPAFDEDWLELRHDIKMALGSEQLPPIHLRLMYGRTLPKKYRGQRNPYLDADFQQVQEWLERALKIARKVSFERRGLAHYSGFRSREDYKPSINSYFADPYLIAEMKFLKENSYGARKNMALRYLKKAWRPLLHLLVDYLPLLNEMMSYIGNKTVSLKIDPFPDAQGVDELEVFDAINRVSQLTQITEIERVEDGDNVQIAQLADLFAFIRFRAEMGKRGAIQPDLVLKKMSERSRPKDFITADPLHLVRRRVGDFRTLTVPVHYAVARRVIEEADSEFADTYLVTVDEFKKRVKSALETSPTGLSILKDPSLCKHLIEVEGS